jgi:uncharacterized protein (DUF433 family)
MVIEAQAPPLRMDDTGAIRVGGTRVTLDTVIGEFLDGATAESIAEAYPAVSLADVYATIGYYLKHSEPIDEYLRRREASGEQLRRQIESSPDYQPKPPPGDSRRRTHRGRRIL